MTRQEKCTKQHAQTAKKNVKCRSNRAATGLFTAGSATKSIDRRDIKASGKETLTRSSIYPSYTQS